MVPGINIAFVSLNKHGSVLSEEKSYWFIFNYVRSEKGKCEI